MYITHSIKKGDVMSRKRRVFKGARFTKLEVLELIGYKYYGKNKKKIELWKCICDCGSIVEYTSNSLCSKAKSCGCMHIEHAHKQGINNRKHKQGTIIEQNTLSRILQRCYNPQSNKDKINYMDRGITVCDRWNPKINKNAYENFINDMGNRPKDKYMIDRIDNNKGYYPYNCRWANHSESNINRRPFKKRSIND